MHLENKASKEQRILRVTRKLLASIVRETTPSPGLKHTLSEGTRQDIRMCFSLISARERELAQEAGIKLNERPRYADEPANSSVVSLDALRKTRLSPDSENEDSD